MARNDIVKATKQILNSLEVVNSITASHAKLLPPLQNQALFVANGSALTLHCAPTSTATKKGNLIRWTFTRRSSSPSSSSTAAATAAIPLPTADPNELHIPNTTVHQNDGIYQCNFGDEYQVSKLTCSLRKLIALFRQHFRHGQSVHFNFILSSLSLSFKKISATLFRRTEQKNFLALGYRPFSEK